MAGNNGVASAAIPGAAGAVGSNGSSNWSAPHSSPLPVPSPSPSPSPPQPPPPPLPPPSWNIIPEVEVAAALPADGFLPAYVRYACQQNSAPAAYHLACGLLALASVVHPDLRIGVVDPKRPLYTPLWILLVGPPGVGNKSRAVRVVRSLLEAVDASCIGPMPGSAEGLFDSLEAQPKQTALWSDFGQFLSATRDGNYAAPMRDLLLPVYDCEPIQRRLANGKDKRVDCPQLTLVGAVTPAHLERFVDHLEWEGGFVSRFTPFVALPERHVATAKLLPELWQQLVDQLTAVREGQWGDCTTFAPEAAALWASWTRRIFDCGLTSDPRRVSVYARMPATALKCAVLIAVSRGRALEGASWQLSADDLRRGILLARMQRRCLEWAVTDLCISPYQRDRRDVLAFLHDAVRGGAGSGGSQGVSGVLPWRRDAPARLLSEITRHVRLPPKRLEGVLAGLEQEGLVAKMASPRGVWYVAADGAAVAGLEARLAPPNGGKPGELVDLDEDGGGVAEDGEAAEITLDNGSSNGHGGRPLTPAVAGLLAADQAS